MKLNVFSKSFNNTWSVMFILLHAEKRIPSYWLIASSELIESPQQHLELTADLGSAAVWLAVYKHSLAQFWR